MPQDVFANTSANWWEGGQKVKPGEKFTPRKLNTPLDKLARKHAGRRALGRIEAVTEQLYAITTECRLTHPATLAISEAAQRDVFAAPGARRRRRTAPSARSRR